MSATTVATSAAIAHFARPPNHTYLTRSFLLLFRRRSRLDALRTDEARQASYRPVDRDRPHPRLPVDRVHAQHAGLAIEHGIDATHEPVAAEDGQDVVPELPLRLRDVHLEPVVEPEQRLGPVTVVDESVERRQERHPVR